MARRPFMRPSSWKLGGSVLVVLALAGCGLFVMEKRAAWRGEAESACLAAHKELRTSAYFEQARAISGPGACGMDYPFRVSAFGEGSIALKSRPLLACPAITTTDRWFAEIVQPAAMLYFGQPVTAVNAGSYSCRSMNNKAGAARSEHSFGNAVDIMSLTLADGRVITILKGWRGAPEEQEFLREIFVGSCRYFSTVLGPGADAYHYDHLHLDLARHAKGRTICKPVIKFAPRIDPEHPMTYTMPSATPAILPDTPSGSPRYDLPPEGPLPDDGPEADAGGGIPTASIAPAPAPLDLTPPDPAPRPAPYPISADTPATGYTPAPYSPSPPPPARRLSSEMELRPPGLVGR
ncbi:extensin-like domain-containing protein [Chelatococcus asaccharovorans]|uniref:extensin-like domain-containing protein n=1 Tax=Chelatococcus asaccharovorans TaxID=28210 RepID=UPI00224C725F|nr:extensin family protein [Chelatococcus asaccharovorans]CAH1663991.1 Extensin-like protein [Chelatococcus asaccharovorans]CAH1682593.1 Extensin-like protein [Chelatococcus asaccharovorans]